MTSHTDYQIPPMPPPDSPELSPDYCHTHQTTHTEESEDD